MTSAFPPGPDGVLLFGNALQIRKDPLSFLSQCAAKYGDVVLLRIGGQKVYLLNHPDYIKRVLVTESNHFRKSNGLPTSRFKKFLLGGEYLYQLIRFPGDDEFWPREGNHLRSSFQKSSVEAYRDIMVESIERTLGRWCDREVIDVHTQMMQLALDIAATTLFGRLSAEDRETMLIAIEIIMKEIVIRAANPLQLFPIVPTPRNVALHRSVQQLDKLLDKLIAQNRENDDACGFLLKSLLLSQRDTGNLNDPEWRFQLIALFIAGYETTAVALTWAWYLLSQNRGVLAKLWRELEGVLSGSPPTIEGVRRLKYTEAIVWETLRLYPPIWLYAARWTLRDLVFGKYDVPPGTAVLISPWITHRDPKYFPEPLSFDPDRWTDGKTKAPDFSYIPFGAGLRRCVGSHFAMLETVLTMATVAQRYELKLMNDGPVQPKPYVGLRPLQPVRMQLQAR